ncbi:hypothetical protein PFBG_04460 [Plasmodium falciparum 7G8]|uniref:Uncharacterized protein n=2 Tax=Plasmodium falciparum TaxID=5833 RepID=A0A024WL05_PLAFA|nr:hypothetical protein PFMALIP_04281 [Plasmodium falciparum MaliPS096_E11]EUR66882.1 hypothetical protein PFBG_04460 [Plasmodium falciparum 7G8]
MNNIFIQKYLFIIFSYILFALMKKCKNINIFLILFKKKKNGDITEKIIFDILKKLREKKFI